MFWGVFIVSVIATRIYFGEVLWVLSFVLGIGANVIFRKFYPRKPDVVVPPEDDEEEENVHAKAAEDMKDAKNRIREMQEALRKARAAAERPAEKPLNLTETSLKVLRNALLQHHNMKQTDRSYTESALCRNTNNLLQQLNAMIDKEKRTA